jgi:hypothetical protein
MMETRFGRPRGGLLHRLRPVRIDVADLRDVADAVLPSLSTGDVRVTVVDGRSAGSVVVCEEDERRVQVPLADLAEDMAGAGVAADADGMAAALSSWVAHRPVTDAAAAASGLAVLDWADAQRTTVAWRVVVRRGDVALAWTPSPLTAAADLHRTRAVALARSRDVRLDLRVEGPVALWSHGAVPLLATAALAAPEQMLARIAAAGLRMADMHVVVTPHRPLACAGAGVAARLAGETGEDCVTLPWPRLADLSWADPRQEM